MHAVYAELAKINPKKENKPEQSDNQRGCKQTSGLAAACSEERIKRDLL